MLNAEATNVSAPEREIEFHEVVTWYDLPPLLTLALDRILPHNRDKTPVAMLIEGREFLARWLKLFEHGAIGGHFAKDGAIDWAAPSEIVTAFEFEDERIADAVEVILDSAAFSAADGGDEGDQITEAIGFLEDVIAEAAGEAVNDG